MLISLVLYALGIPLWMVVGMLLLVLWNRKRVKSQPNVFPVKIRKVTNPEDASVAKWSRRAGYAQWVHDVLIVRTGPGLMITTPYGIDDVDDIVEGVDPEEVKGLGEEPVIVSARLDDGSSIQLAIREIRPELAPSRFLEGRALVEGEDRFGGSGLRFRLD